jgi:hypothetical protein
MSTEDVAAMSFRIEIGIDCADPAELAPVLGEGTWLPQANTTDRFDADIHNAADGSSGPRRIVTTDGLSHAFAVNVLALYVSTALIGATPGGLLEFGHAMRRPEVLSNAVDPGWVATKMKCRGARRPFAGTCRRGSTGGQ